MLQTSTTGIFFPIRYSNFQQVANALLYHHLIPILSFKLWMECSNVVYIIWCNARSFWQDRSEISVQCSKKLCMKVVVYLAAVQSYSQLSFILPLNLLSSRKNHQSNQVFIDAYDSATIWLREMGKLWAKVLLHVITMTFCCLERRISILHSNK